MAQRCRDILEKILQKPFPPAMIQCSPGMSFEVDGYNEDLKVVLEYDFGTHTGYYWLIRIFWKEAQFRKLGLKYIRVSDDTPESQLENVICEQIHALRLPRYL